MAAGYDISLAGSSSASAGITAPFNVTTGGGKTQSLIWIVLGVVAVIGLVFWFKKGGG